MPSVANKPLAAKAIRISLRLGYVVLLGMGFAFCAYASFKLFVRSGVTPVPDLDGLTEPAAAALLEDQGLDLRHGERGDRFDANAPPGTVIRQDPAPRTLVKRGSSVAVALSLGPERQSVPDLTGSALPAAQVALAAAGLDVGRALQVFSAREVGSVVQQFPPAGSSVPPHTRVDLLLSQGDDSKTFLMPDLVYRDYDGVRSFFLRRGFRFGSVKFEIYEGAQQGVILRQFPLAGHPLTRQDAISVVVAAAADAQSPAPGIG